MDKSSALEFTPHEGARAVGLGNKVARRVAADPVHTEMALLEAMEKDRL